MKRAYLAVAAMIILTPGLFAADEVLPKAETILDRFVDVTGGKAAYERRKNEVVVVEMEFVGRGIKGTVTRYADTSNNTISTGEIEGVGKFDEGVYNGQAWENSPMMGPRLKSGEENASAVRDSNFLATINWRKLYKAETAGIEKINNEDCYKLVLTPLGEGKPQTTFYSKKTGLLLRSVRTAVSPMGEMNVEITPGEYQVMDGIMTPKKLVQSVMGTEISLTVLSVKSNVEMPKDRFEPPAEIKKLLEKKP